MSWKNRPETATPSMTRWSNLSSLWPDPLVILPKSSNSGRLSTSPPFCSFLYATTREILAPRISPRLRPAISRTNGHQRRDGSPWCQDEARSRQFIAGCMMGSRRVWKDVPVQLGPTLHLPTYRSGALRSFILTSAPNYCHRPAPLQSYVFCRA